jgi:hypothetical protein
VRTGKTHDEILANMAGPLMKFERRSLELTPEQWQVLEWWAARLGATAPTGPAAGQPSWRTLIKRLADRELVIQPQPINEDHIDAA